MEGFKGASAGGSAWSTSPDIFLLETAHETQQGIFGARQAMCMHALSRRALLRHERHGKASVRLAKPACVHALTRRCRHDICQTIKTWNICKASQHACMPSPDADAMTSLPAALLVLMILTLAAGKDASEKQMQKEQPGQGAAAAAAAAAAVVVVVVVVVEVVAAAEGQLHLPEAAVAAAAAPSVGVFAHVMGV
eukprot:1144657-Pelagomonas_calceolata.AAC.2